jgi:hypothetical protein
MSADNTILRENLDEWIVGRQGDLVTLANKLHQNTLATSGQSADILHPSAKYLCPPLNSTPPINQPANHNDWRNACQKPSCNGMPHSANPPNEKS